MLKIAGCGDIFISDRIPTDDYSGYRKLREFLVTHRICFGNLETTIHNNDGYPSLFPGGGYAMASPGVLRDIHDFGFRILSIANNHAMDYSQKGLEATLRHLNETDLKYAGAGMNLTEASRPAYVETPEGRTAIIAFTSSFHDSDAAGNQSVDVPGRPGVNPLRHTELLQVTPDLMEAVRQIAEKTGVNEYRELGEKNGYVISDQSLKLRDLRFVEGPETKRITHPLKTDMERMCLLVREAATQADCVIVSLHGHQMRGSDNYPEEFIVEFCRKAVESGANIVFCHGAHVIRGIELYQGGAIFYGLGNFIMKNELQQRVPADFYEKYDVDSGLYGLVGIPMDKRSINGTRGLGADPKVWQSFLPSIGFNCEKRIIEQIDLIPLTLHFELPRSRRGWPEITEETEVLRELQRISEVYGTTIEIEGSEGKVCIR